MSERKCFCNWGWTEQISLTQLAKFRSARMAVGAALALKQPIAVAWPDPARANLFNLDAV
jgi:hypothetical protein